MLKKAFFIIGFFLSINLTINAQQEIYTQRDIDIYKKEATQLVNYFEYTLNLIGSKNTLAKEKDIIINQSFSKIFLDENVQIEDDLDEYRTVPTNKNVQAYLKDIDFFFTNAEIVFTIEEVSHHLTEDNGLYFKFKINRNLIGNLISGDSINTNKVRFIEINLDDALQDLKIASIYTTKLNEDEEQRNWWNSISENWKKILGQNRFIDDSVYLHELITFTDSTYVILADSFQVFQLDSLLVYGPDTISLPSFDSLIQYYHDTITFDPAILYEHLSDIIRLQEINLNEYPEINDLSPLSKLSNLRKIDLSNTNVKDLSPLRNLTKLESLICSGSKVESLFHLRYLTNLKVLNLNHTMVYTLDELDHFDKLEQLYLIDTKIDSLDPIAALKNLQDLRFSNTNISDLDALSNLSGLEVLHINATNVNSIAPLKNLENLRILVMDDTKVDQLEPLSNHKNLKQIFCDNSLISPAKANQFMKANSETLVVFQSAELNAWWDHLNTTWKNIFKKYIYLDAHPSKAQLHELIKQKIIDVSKRSEISNLEPLKKLIYLEHLNCSQTSISDLEPIADLIDLKYLDISLTNINSIAHLKNLSKLESLYFSSTSVDDLSPLLNLNFLQQVHGNFTEVKNLNPLAELPNLKFAYFDNTKVDRSDFLKLFTKNKELVVVYQTRFLQNWWESINEHWKELFIKKINIKNDELSKESLQQIADIKSLDISNNLQLKTLEPLKVLSTLEELIFSGTQISNLNALENLKQLSKITCANNPINNLSAIMNLPNLKYLDISNIPIRDFEQIQFMTSLETLICPGTQIKSLKYLDYLRNLKTLECFNTNIRNLNAVENLDLEVLKCYNTGLNQKRVSKFKQTHPNTEVVYY